MFDLECEEAQPYISAHHVVEPSCLEYNSLSIVMVQRCFTKHTLFISEVA